MAYRFFFREWRLKKIMWWIMIAELAGTVSALVMFGIAQPDAYRTTMWKVGFLNHFNSNPNMILYAYANHRPLPKIPFVWSQTLTNFNVAISVLSLFVLLAKLISFIMKVYYPVIGVFASFAMTALYATSVYGQAGPDYADSRYPSPVAWYIRKSCDPARPWNAYKSCQLAKGSFAVTVYLLFIYVVMLGLAINSMIPRKDDKMLDEEEDDSPKTDKHYEMMPATPRQPMPFTPRTQAFHTLDRKLPFRQQQYT